MPSYDGCPGSLCCAEDTLSCEGACLYGRKLFCSTFAGGNATAPEPFGDCGGGRTCFIGSPDVSCPQISPPAGTICGVNIDPTTRTETSCWTVCGPGSVESQNNTSLCPQILGFSPRCCARSTDACGGCQFGRREYCALAGNNDPLAAGKTCLLGGTCFIGEPDSSCPQVPPPTAPPICGVTPVNNKDSYCSISCGGNAALSGYSGCNGLACCLGTTAPQFPGVPAASEYVLCEQIPDATAKSACQACVNNPGGSGIWTAIGCIKTDFASIAQTAIKLGLGMGGGFALLLILFAGFSLSTSQGDPKRTSEAKELITSVVIGLLFIIFSITILQFVGVSIFKIPGFGG